MSSALSVLEGQVAGLGTQVDGLQTEMRDMRLILSKLATLPSRIEAVEASQRATDERNAHIDRVVMDIQLQLQQFQKSLASLTATTTSSIASVEAAQAQTTSKLDLLLQNTNRVLELLQPKATL